jgi:hypothetical protein
MYSQLKEKYTNIKAMIKNLPQNTTAQKIAVDLLVAYGKPASTIIENCLENALFESTPVDVNTEMEIKKIQLQTKLTDAKTSLLLAQKEHVEMENEYQELLEKQREKEEKEALEKAKKLVANHENGKNVIKDTVKGVN